MVITNPAWMRAKALDICMQNATSVQDQDEDMYFTVVVWKPYSTLVGVYNGADRFCMRRSRGGGADPHVWGVKCGSLSLDDVTRLKETTPDRFPMESSQISLRLSRRRRGGLDDRFRHLCNDRQLSSNKALGAS